MYKIQERQRIDVNTLKCAEYGKIIKKKNEPAPTEQVRNV